MASSLGGTSTASQTEQIADAYKRTQQFKLDNIKKKQTDLENTSRFFNTINTRLNSIVSEADKYSADNIADKFTSKKVDVSDATYATVTATKDAVNGISTLKVNQLATNDRLVSARNTLADNFGITGKETISFTVNSKTYSAEIEFTGNETNEQAMKKIANALNSIKDTKVTAAVIKDTGTTGKIVFTAGDTGEDFKLNFTDGNILQKVGITSAIVNPNSATRTTSSTTGAGFSKGNVADLNAKADINGIEITNSSNTLTDVLSGTTITLIKAQDTASQALNLTISEDFETVKSFIQPLLNSYNELLNTSKGDKNVRRSEPSITSLSSTLRSIASSSMGADTSGTTLYLSTIGIKADKNGNLSISDADMFKKVLKESPEKIQSIFTGENGLVKKITTAISTLKGDSGIIKSKTLSISKQISDMKAKYDSTSSLIDRQAENTKKQYENTLKVYLEAQSQYGSASSLIGQA